MPSRNQAISFENKLEGSIPGLSLQRCSFEVGEEGSHVVPMQSRIGDAFTRTQDSIAVQSPGNGVGAGGTHAGIL